MKKIAQKLLCFTLALLLCSLSLLSCNKPSESDEELLSIAKELTEASAAVNRLLFGEGILPDEDGEKIGAYKEASADSLAAYGVTGMDSIEQKAESVYSLATVSWIKNTLLSSSKDEETGTVLTYARYYLGLVEQADKTKKEVFLVYTDYKATVGEASYSDYKLIKKEKDTVSFSVTVTVTYGDKAKVYKDTEITMFREAHGWRLDTPTYATFE